MKTLLSPIVLIIVSSLISIQFIGQKAVFPIDDLAITTFDQDILDNEEVLEKPASTILRVNEEHSLIRCNGGTSLVNIVASGGIGPYKGTGSFYQSAGTQEYKVTDATGKVEKIVVSLTEPSLLVATEKHETIKAEARSTDVYVSANGGTHPYYGNGLYRQAAGTVTYIVTDSHGCKSSVVATIKREEKLENKQKTPKNKFNNKGKFFSKQ